MEGSGGGGGGEAIERRKVMVYAKMTLTSCEQSILQDIQVSNSTLEQLVTTENAKHRRKMFVLFFLLMIKMRKCEKSFCHQIKTLSKIF